MANTYKIPTLMSAITMGTPSRVLPNGTTAMVVIAGTMARQGASQ